MAPRLLGSALVAATAAVLLPAAPWICAMAVPNPDAVPLTAGIAQMAWLVIWVRRCRSQWVS